MVGYGARCVRISLPYYKIHGVRTSERFLYFILPDSIASRSATYCSFVYGFYGSKVLSGYAKAVLGNSAGALYAYTHVYVCIHIRTTANGGPGSFAGRARSDLAGPIWFWQGQARQIWLSRTLTSKAHATDLQVAQGGPFSSD